MPGALHKLRAQFDWPLFLPVISIIFIGLVNLYSATRVAPKGLFVQQLWWYGIGSLLFVAAAAVDYRVIQRYAFAIYVSLLLLLLFVLVGGKTVNGSRRWLGFGSLGGQPSELMKIGLILALSRLFSGDPLDLEFRPWRYAIGWHLLLGAPALLILKQPDLGTALICILVAGTMLLAVRLRPVVKAAVPRKPAGSGGSRAEAREATPKTETPPAAPVCDLTCQMQRAVAGTK